MGSERLTTKERAALLALLGVGRRISNPELKEQVGFTLVDPQRSRLNDLKLVKSDRKPGRAYFHKLTEEGLKRCVSELSAGPGPRAATMERTLYAILGGLDGYLQRTRQGLENIFYDAPDATVTGNGRHAAPPVAPADVNSRIQAAYWELADEPGAFVRLHELRVKLADIPRADLDTALDEMYQEHLINLVAQTNQEALTADDRDSELYIGGSRKHRISIERS